MKFIIDIIKRFKQQITNLSIYLLASIIPMLFSLLTNPLIAMNMSPTDYAIVGYYAAFNTLLAPFINFYLLHYYTKRFFELNVDERIVLKATLFKSLIFFSLLLTLVSILGLYVYTILFNLDSQIPFLPYAIMSIFVLPIIGIYSLNLVEYRMQRKSKAFFRLSVSNGLLGVLLTLLFVVVLKYGALGRLSAQLLSGIIIFSYCFYSNRKLLSIKFDKKIFKNSMIFCFPLVIAAMLSFFSTGFDKILLERGGNIIELGYYVVGVSIAGYIGIFSNSINDTFQPDIFQSIVQKKFRKCAKIIFVKSALISVIVFIFIVLAPYIVNILTAGRYVNSTKYAVIVSLSAITSMIYHSFSQVTIALGYTKITLINKVIGSALCIMMFYFLISKFGAIGAAWGTVMSFMIFFIGNIGLVALKYKKNNNEKNN